MWTGWPEALLFGRASPTQGPRAAHARPQAREWEHVLERFRARLRPVRAPPRAARNALNQCGVVSSASHVLIQPAPWNQVQTGVAKERRYLSSVWQVIGAQRDVDSLA